MTYQEKQDLKKKYIPLICEGKITGKQAAKLIGISEEAVSRLKQRYKKDGDIIFINGHTGLKSKKNNELREKISNIFFNTRVDNINPFENITYANFHNILESKYGIKISKKSLTRILKQLGYKSPKNYTKKNIPVIKPTGLLKRKSIIGELIYCGCSTIKLFDRKYLIYGFVDDSSSKPFGLYITKTKCYNGYSFAYKRMVAGIGIPKEIYSNEPEIFIKNIISDVPEEEAKKISIFSDFMISAGSIVKFCNTKRISVLKRFWGTLNGQLEQRLKLNGYKTITDINNYLEIYINEYKTKNL